MQDNNADNSTAAITPDQAKQLGGDGTVVFPNAAAPAAVTPEQAKAMGGDGQVYHPETTQPDVAVTVDQAKAMGGTGEVVHPTADKPTDVWGSVVRGAKEAVFPWALTAEDLKDPHSVGETIVQAGSSFATFLGGTAALTAVAGTALGGAEAGAAVGPAGAAIGGVAGLIAGGVMALNRGVGTEYAYSNADHREFNAKNAAVNVAHEAVLNGVVPWVKDGGKLLNGLAVAALADLQGEQYAEPGDHKGPAIQALVEGGLTALLHSSPSARRLASAATIGDALANGKQLPTSAAALLAKVGSRADYEAGDAARDYFAAMKKQAPTPDEGAKAFGGANFEDFKDWWLNRRIGGLGKSDMEFDPAWAKFSPKLQGQDWDAYLYSLAHGQAAQDINGQMVDDLKLGNVKSSVVQDPNSALGVEWGDGTFVTRNYDRTLGTDLSGALYSVSQMKNKLNNAQLPFLKQMREVDVARKKAGLDDVLLGRALCDKLPEDVTLTADQQVVVQHAKQFFDDARGYLRDQGYDVGYVDKYLPTTEVPSFMKHAKVKNLYDNLKGELGGKNILGFDDASASTIKDATAQALGISRAEVSTEAQVKQAIDKLRAVNDPQAGELSTTYSTVKQTTGLDNIFDGRSKDILELKAAVGNTLDKSVANVNDEAMIGQSLDEMLRPTNKRPQSSLGFTAPALFPQSINPMPEFLRDYSFRNTGLNYISGNFKSLFLNAPLQELQTLRMYATARGWRNTGDWIDTYVQNMSGYPGGVKAWLDSKTATYRAGIQLALERHELTPGQAQAKNLIPDFMSWSISQIYPNEIGLSFRSALRDFTKPFLLTAPEVGGGYGQRLLARASFRLATGGGVDQVYGIGMKSKDVYGEIARLKGGLFEAPGLVGKSASMIQWLSERSMKMYDATDTLNRALTYHMGQLMAQDLIAGDAAALKAINARHVGSGLQQELKAAADSGMSAKDLGDKLALYLNNKTQFNYGPDGMNQWGRDMGKVFSMFTKWPAMVGGDMLELAKDRNFGKLATKYLAPWVALGVASKVMNDGDRSPVSKLLLGRGVGDFAPAGAVLPDLDAKGQGGFAGLKQPPVIEAGTELVGTLSKAITDDWGNDPAAAAGNLAGGVFKAVRPFVPGAGMVHKQLEKLHQSFDNR